MAMAAPPAYAGVLLPLLLFLALNAGRWLTTLVALDHSMGYCYGLWVLGIGGGRVSWWVSAESGAGFGVLLLCCFGSVLIVHWWVSVALLHWLWLWWWIGDGFRESVVVQVSLWASVGTDIGICNMGCSSPLFQQCSHWSHAAFCTDFGDRLAMGFTSVYEILWNLELGLALFDFVVLAVLTPSTRCLLHWL